jgi:hypothetical protein
VPETGPDDVTTQEADVVADTYTADVPAETSVCNTLGCKCSGNTDCASNICADAQTVTTQLYGEVNHGFCIQPCCTSTDCPGGFVCYPTAVGGNYCIDPSLLSRSTTLGASIGGTSCGTASQCRSGVCSGGTCQDTCCSMFQSSECGGSSTCRYGTFPGSGSVDQHYASHCTTSGGGSGGNQSPCSNDSNCKSNFCFTVTGACSEACESSADCASGFCSYATNSSSDIIAICGYPTGSVGLGGTCVTDTECATAYCDTNTKKCTDVCYLDSNCSAMPGWRCRPESYKVGVGTLSILLCGP